MKNYLILLLCMVTFGTVNAQVSGTALLLGQTNHSGIRVKFTSQSGTAVTDSAFTTSTGNYSINITPGVYSISFSKPGYVDVFYNNNSNTVLTNTSALTGVSLTPGNAVMVSGNVSGTWTGNNVYIINGYLTVPTGSVLSIMAGATVMFNGYYAITGGGMINAIGSQANPILFTSNMQNKGRNDWNTIGFNGTNSTFDYCIFEYATLPLDFHNASANVTNSIFRHCGTMAAYFGMGNPLFSDNEIYDIFQSSGNAAVGVWMEAAATGTISCNTIHDISSLGWNSYGVIHNNSLVRDNHISNITGYNGQGIQTRYSGARNINNCISNCGIGIGVDASWEASDPLIANNTIFSNTTAIQMGGGSKPVNAIIVNNIITGNTNGINSSAGGTPVIDHNLVWGQSSANYNVPQVTGLGQMISTNSAGFQTDAYFNMSQDPLYSGAPPLLSSASPCNGSANTNHSQEIGYRDAQACRTGTSNVVSVMEYKNPARLNVFPNPCKDSFILAGVPPGGMAITIFDLNGRLVYSGTAMPDQPVNISGLNSGVYTLSVRTAQGTRHTLLAKTE